MTRLKRFSAFVLVATLAAPLSLSAENRTPRRSSLADLARELESVLGRGSVEVSRSRTTTAKRAGEDTRAPLPPSYDSLSAAAIVAATNRERAAHGLAPLRLNSKLSLAAGDRITDMFHQRYFDHVAPDGTQPFVWARRRGYSYSLIGENLAVGYPTAQRVVTGWMNSPGHRQNILQRGFDEVGIAVSSGAPLRGYSGPTIVAMYGRS
ncbi:MAG TPA: CAP domain-containing protein [Thermoanaerobaculia bacterium]|nr:CAP domain-containing protein [Thermoanaerobaculia bacterium]